MRIQIFPFWFGLILLTIGLIWIVVAFSQASRESQNFSLEGSDSGSTSIMVEGRGIGFYLISSESYQNKILVKIVDPSGNFLDIRKITNRVTVNYFHFEHSEQVTLEVTNLSNKPVQLSTTIGDTRLGEVTFPALLIFCGASVLMFSGYKKLKNYITAHPDENSS